MKRLFYLIIFIFLVAIYSVFVYSVGDDLDVHDAVKYYIKWVQKIYEIEFSKLLLWDLYITNIKFLFSPSPGSSWIVYLISLIFPYQQYVFDFINILTIGSMVMLIYNSKFKRYKLVLIFYFIAFSFYFYVLFHMTHRFKIAVLFYTFYLNATILNKNKYAKIFLTIALLSHLTMLLCIPFHYVCARYEKNRNLFFSQLKFVFIFYFISSILIFYSRVSHDTEFASTIWQNKFSNIEYIFPVLIIFLSLFIIFRKKLNFIYQKFDLMIQILIITGLFIFVDSSRSFMVVFILVMLNLISFDSKEFKLTPYLLVPFILWDLFRALYQGSIYLLFDSL